ncbi:MAG: hypothetical protein M3Y91_02900 [Actinomycetota bacterium]|nr:hypothetical protein [Actinomycetota bacterium]
MRIVEWNCRSRFAAKLPALDGLRPDVAILAEAPMANPRPDATLTEPALSWVATGEYAFKALAVAGFTAAVTPRPPESGSGQWSLAVDHPAGFGVLGIWSAPPEGQLWGDQVTATLDAHADWVRAGPVIVAGDFNIEFGGREDRRHKTFAGLLERMDALGLVSAYHVATGAAHGDEPARTHFFRTKADAGFHIDFVLVPKVWAGSITHVEVGSYDEWVGSGFSDHVPVVVDFDL